MNSINRSVYAVHTGRAMKAWSLYLSSTAILLALGCGSSEDSGTSDPFATGGAAAVTATGGAAAVTATGGAAAVTATDTGGAAAVTATGGTASGGTSTVNSTLTTLKFCNNLTQNGLDFTAYLQTQTGPSVRLTALSGACSACTQFPAGQLSFEMGSPTTWLSRGTWTPSVAGGQYFVMAEIDDTDGLPTWSAYRITTAGETCATYNPFL